MQMKGHGWESHTESAHAQAPPLVCVKFPTVQNSGPSLLLGSLEVMPLPSVNTPQLVYVSGPGAGTVVSSHTKSGQGLATAPSQ